MISCPRQIATRRLPVTLLDLARPHTTALDITEAAGRCRPRPCCRDPPLPGVSKPRWEDPATGPTAARREILDRGLTRILADGEILHVALVAPDGSVLASDVPGIAEGDRLEVFEETYRVSVEPNSDPLSGLIKLELQICAPSDSR